MADFINAMFELLGGLFVATSCVRLYKDKVVRGITTIHISFFVAWAYWNLYFYPAYGAWFSFYGGIGVTLANTVWVAQVIYYNRKNGNAKRA